MEDPSPQSASTRCRVAVRPDVGVFDKFSARVAEVIVTSAGRLPSMSKAMSARRVSDANVGRVSILFLYI